MFLGRILKGILLVILLLFALILVLLTLANWQRSMRETQSRAEAAPRNGRFIRISDGEIFIQETGTVDDRPVLFIHGTGAWSELWRETLDQCPAFGQYCIGIDVPPFGFSAVDGGSQYTRVDQARRILELMQQVRPRATFTLVGHSFGAGPTVEAVMRDPSHVGALVVVDGALGIDDPPSGPGPINAILSSRIVRNSILSAVVTNPLFTKQLILPLLYKKEAATESRVQLLQRPLVVKDATDHLGDWALNFFSSAGEENLSRHAASYSGIAVPTLVIWGEQDTITPLPQGERLHALLPTSRLVRFAGVGHMPQIEDVGAFNAALFDFLQRKI